MAAQDIVVQKSSIDNQGVFAARDFKKGEVVVRWSVEKELSSDDVAQLDEHQKRFVSEISNGKFVLIGEPARYVNHSCEPNTSAHNGTDVALRDIKRGEEITADYDQEKVPIQFACRCGSKNCRGNIGENIT